MHRSAQLRSLTRALTPGEVLRTVRSDPGMTATYYANRYFGKEKAMQVNHVLWGELKRHGKVDLVRADGPEEPPRWHPVFESVWRHKVHYHNAEDEDLSLLRSDSVPPPPPPEPTAAPSPPTQEDSGEWDPLGVDSMIVRAVQREPGRDIQHYISALPQEMQQAAPAAFKRLRESGLLTRQETPQGFLWK